MRMFSSWFYSIAILFLVACSGDTDTSPEGSTAPPPEIEMPVEPPEPTDPVPPEVDEDDPFTLPVDLEENQVIVFYQREDGVYEDWGLHLWDSPGCNALDDELVASVVWESPFMPTGIDDENGAYYVLDTKNDVGCFNLIVHRGDDKAIGGADLIFNMSQGKILIASDISGDLTYPSDPSSALPFSLTENQAAVVYKREDGDYEGWGVHLWNNETCGSLADSTLVGVEWATPKLPDGIDDTIGAYMILDLARPQGCFNFIVHKGDEKAFGDADLQFDLTQGNIVFGSHASELLRYSGNQAEPIITIAGSGAHMVDAQTLVWLDAAGAAKVEVRASADGSIDVVDGVPQGGNIITAQPGEISVTAAQQFPHIAQWPAWAVEADSESVKVALKGQLVALAYDDGDELIAATRVQTPGAIDALFVNDTTLNMLLGASLSEAGTQFNVWAPTATSMRLHVWSESFEPMEGFPVDMQNTNGVWSFSSDIALRNAYYQYEVTVYHYATGQIETTRTTDPYSLSLSANGVYSQVISLNSAETKPDGWDEQNVPTVERPEQTIIYETHIRDFSVIDNTTSEANRGKYLAFTESASNAVLHLKQLQEAGLNHIHLLPTFDITTVNEETEQTINLTNTVEQLCAVKADATICGGQSSFMLPEAIALTESQAVVFYKRDDANYEDWGLHLWNDDTCNALSDQTLDGVEWTTPHVAEGIDTDLGAYYILETMNESCVNFIVHKGDEKALGEANSKLELTNGKIVVTNHGESGLQYREEGAVVADSRTLQEVMESFAPATNQAQALLNEFRQLDSFNWGYDPYHFTVPDGSYASNPNGPTRIVEFRQMVKALHDVGFRVVMDVVYNHTSSSGLADTSVLDKLVPGYYHRLNESSGNIEKSSCCENTASENLMMEKLMIDSLVVWARDYKIDGFRFDLMGHHMTRNMEKALAAVVEIDADTYFYGEAWNFGEVQDSRRGENAIQKNVGGLGIGTFNDRIRDAVRGGGPFDEAFALRRNQGFGTGLYHYPNDLNSGSDLEKDDLNTRADWIRLSLAGNLKSYRLETASGDILSGEQIDYQGQQAGYTLDPQENVNYISKHDNQTLWDNQQYKVANELSSKNRTRMHNFALSVPMFAQGAVFLHMGVDVLRSKSMQRDSFDSGDWFNAVDFTGANHKWNVGLPSEEKDGGNYAVIGSRLSDMNAKPAQEDIDMAKAVFKEWIAIRSSSPLFSLETADAVNNMVSFHNTGDMQIPGVIVMKLTDTAGVDSAYQSLVVVFNSSNVSQTMPFDGSEAFSLHPVQQMSTDVTTQTAIATEAGLVVPALTTAVFVLPEAP